jgi:stress-induced morphogen
MGSTPRKEEVKMFETYRPVLGYRVSTEKVVSISNKGQVHLSPKLVGLFNLSKSHRHEILFDRSSRKIAIRFVSPDFDGYSRAMTLARSGSIHINCDAFFRHFHLRTPAKSTRFTPTIEGDTIIFEYPEILVAGE